MFEDLKKKLNDKNFVVSIIGLGYVGLPLSLLFAKKGIKTKGIDIDQKKIDYLLKGKTYISHIQNETIVKSLNSGFLSVSSDYQEIKKSNVIILCLPTPLNKFREPNLSYIKNTLLSINPFLEKGQLISLESTTYPGTTEELLTPLINKKQFKVGDDFFVVYSPEREDPGNKKYNTENIPKIVGGLTEQCTELGSILYSKAIKKVFKVSNTKVAEMTKLLENIHRCVNISLINELKPLCLAMGIDIYEVINAAKTKPFGFSAYYPGPGLGGHCIPIDPFYLTWKAREFNMSTKFIELSGEVNASMPGFVVKRTIEALNSKCKSINKSKILILGISYKKNIDDIRESPSIEIIKILSKQGAIINYSDPYFPEFPKTRKLNFKSNSINLDKKVLNHYDIVLLLADHDAFDYELIKEESNLIVDTRGVFQSSPKVILA